jgi:hypothetical protein
MHRVRSKHAKAEPTRLRRARRLAQRAKGRPALLASQGTHRLIVPSVMGQGRHETWDEALTAEVSKGGGEQLSALAQLCTVPVPGPGREVTRLLFMLDGHPGPSHYPACLP